MGTGGGVELTLTGMCVLLPCSVQAEKVHELNEEIGKLLAKAEQLGAEGNVDEAQKVLQEVEKVRSTKKDAEVRWSINTGLTGVAYNVNDGSVALRSVSAPVETRLVQ